MSRKTKLTVSSMRRKTHAFPGSTSPTCSSFSHSCPFSSPLYEWDPYTGFAELPDDSVQEIHHPMCFPPRFQLLGSPSEVYTALSPKHVSLTSLCNEHLTHLSSTFLHLSISITRAEVACLFPVCIWKEGQWGLGPDLT